MQNIVYPSSLGGCIDMLYAQRAERLDRQKIIDNAKKEEAKLEQHILDTFSKDELRGAKGDVATAAIKKDTTVELTNWDEFLAWAVQNRAWDVIRRQPGSIAVKARWDNGVEVPGVKPLIKISLSLTKA